MSEADEFVNVNVERRYDEGNLYTKEEFEEYYGSDWKEAWDKAEKEPAGDGKDTSVEAAVKPVEPAVAEAENEDNGFVEVERRYDTDGDLYTKEDFEAFYGGTEEWEQAPREHSDTNEPESTPIKPVTAPATFSKPSWGQQSVSATPNDKIVNAPLAEASSWGVKVPATESKGFAGFSTSGAFATSKPSDLPFQTEPVPEKEEPKPAVEATPSPPTAPTVVEGSSGSPTTTSGSLWKCQKCGTTKEFTGDHLKNKKTMKASCNSKYCAYKSKMWERINPSEQSEDSTPKKESEKDSPAATSPPADTPAANPFSSGNSNPFAKKDDDKKETSTSNPFAVGSSNPFAKKEDASSDPAANPCGGNTFGKMETSTSSVSNPFAAGGSNPFAKKEEGDKKEPTSNPFAAGSSNPFAKKEEDDKKEPSTSNPFAAGSSNPFAKKEEDDKKEPTSNPFAAGSSNPFAKKEEGDKEPAASAASNPFGAASNPFAKKEDNKEVPSASPTSNPFAAGSSNPFAKKEDDKKESSASPTSNPFAAGSSNPFAMFAKKKEDKKDTPVANPFASGSNNPFAKKETSDESKKEDDKDAASNPFASGSSNPFASKGESSNPFAPKSDNKELFGKVSQPTTSNPFGSGNKSSDSHNDFFKKSDSVANPFATNKQTNDQEAEVKQQPEEEYEEYEEEEEEDETLSSSAVPQVNEDDSNKTSNPFSTGSSNPFGNPGGAANPFALR
eukprot:TRINITY_DN293_c0_g1_i12.p1 TRINITY_DN293_c0_g1~~TRINITY_DN293_c0_g1_i12.p1  ORF type:complete len:727 (+),score=275.35 TRINITY_DN293_c0_g1_i12:144-2324(+)